MGLEEWLILYNVNRLRQLQNNLTTCFRTVVLVHRHLCKSHKVPDWNGCVLCSLISFILSFLVSWQSAVGWAGGCVGPRGSVAFEGLPVALDREKAMTDNEVYVKFKSYKTGTFVHSMKQTITHSAIRYVISSQPLSLARSRGSKPCSLGVLRAWRTPGNVSKCENSWVSLYLAEKCRGVSRAGCCGLANGSGTSQICLIS